MKKIFTILILSSLFAGELEVEGDLKVSGNIDAQNNPIKNVGIPTDMNDAVNAQILQDALRDDGIKEFKTYVVVWDDLTHSSHSRYKEIGTSEFLIDWESYINNQSLEGWNIFQIHPFYLSTNNVQTIIMIYRNINE